MIQDINVSQPNDGLGDTLRDAFIKVNENFDELLAMFDDTVTDSELSGAVATINVSLADLQAQIDTKADVGHTHTISEIIGLQNALNALVPYTTYALNNIAFNAALVSINTELTDIIIRLNDAIFEAPINGTQYGRQNGTWTPIVQYTGGTATQDLQMVLDEGDEANGHSITLKSDANSDDIVKINVDNTNDPKVVVTNNGLGTNGREIIVGAGYIQYNGHDDYSVEISYPNETQVGPSQLVLPPESGTIATREWSQTHFIDTNTYVTGATYSGQTLTIRRNDNVNITVTGLTDSQLQLITESGKTGWRLLGRLAARYGDIGTEAVDLSSSSSNSSTRGATGNYSFAVGRNTIAAGESSVAIGNGTRASALYSFAAGNGAIANGQGSTAIGEFAQADGANAFASNVAYAIGDASSAFGQSLTRGSYSFATGMQSEANGFASTAYGLSAFAEAQGETVIGSYPSLISGNATGFTSTDSAFRVGNGIDTVTRSDAFRVYKNGALYLQPTAISGITNGANGFMMFDSNAKRLNLHNGTAFREVAYLDEVTSADTANQLFRTISGGMPTGITTAIYRQGGLYLTGTSAFYSTLPASGATQGTSFGHINGGGTTGFIQLAGAGPNGGIPNVFVGIGLQGDGVSPALSFAAIKDNNFNSASKYTGSTQPLYRFANGYGVLTAGVRADLLDIEVDNIRLYQYPTSRNDSGSTTTNYLSTDSNGRIVSKPISGITGSTGTDYGPQITALSAVTTGHTAQIAILSARTDNNTFVTGGTYSNSGKTLTLVSNSGTSVTVTGVTEISQTITSGDTANAPSSAYLYNTLPNRNNKFVKYDQHILLPTWGTITLNVLAGLSLTLSGSNVLRNFADTNILTRMQRLAYQTTAVAGNSNTGRQVTGYFSRQTGYDYTTRIGASTGASTLGNRAFFGISTQNNNTGNVEYNTMTSIAGIGILSTSTNWQIMHNDNTGTATSVDTGFPCNTVDDELIEVRIRTISAATAIEWTVTRLSTGAIFQYVASSDIPASNQLAALYNGVNNNTNAAVFAVDWCGHNLRLGVVG